MVRTTDIYVKRDLEDSLLKYLPKKEMIAVLGARQCGKTTIINHILDNHEKTNKINRISFENQLTLNLFENDLENFIKKHVEGFDILFIDEVQYSKDSGKKLKYIYDSFNVKILLTGSSAVDVSLNSLKFLVGRINIFYLYPFSFNEFLRAKNERLFKIYNAKKYGSEILKELNELLEEFLIFGGYPRVVISSDIEEKKKTLEDIYSTLLLREIKDLTGLSENYKLVSLINALSLQIGNLVDYSELSRISGLDLNQIKKTIKVLEESFVCKMVRPYYKNKRLEIYKNPKTYFIDSGLRNASLNTFEFPDKGQLYENFIFSELFKKGKKVNFWRTKSKAEVDFVVQEGMKIIPIEVKSNLIETSVTRSYSSFIEKYSPENAFFLSKNFKGERIEDKTLINFETFIDFVRDF